MQAEYASNRCAAGAIVCDRSTTASEAKDPADRRMATLVDGGPSLCNLLSEDLSTNQCDHRATVLFRGIDAVRRHFEFCHAILPNKSATPSGGVTPIAYIA
jgi:hypothetical protein